MVKRPVFLHKENDMLDVLERSSHGGGGRSHQRKGESRLAHLGRMKIQGENLKKVKNIPTMKERRNSLKEASSFYTNPKRRPGRPATS
jgi:hypothetical protein